MPSPRPLLLAALLVLAAAASAAPAPPVDPLPEVERALAQEDPQTALDLLAPWLQRNPRHAPALLARSTARCMLGELAACKKDLEAALAADPGLRQGWLNRSAIAISEERWDDALADLERAEKLDPAALDNALNQGAVELLRGDLPAGTRQFERYLALQPEDAGAWYLVASNYAHSGYAALAVEHLSRAIALDERSRVRARTDANFAGLAEHRGFLALLSTDSWSPPPGALTATRKLPTIYSGAQSPIVVAILNALQLSGARLDPRVEITPDWALFWTDYRIKVLRGADSTTLELTAPPGLFTAASWESRANALFADVEAHLLRLELAAQRQPPPP